MLGFFVLRSRSTVLAAEAETPAMRALARHHGVEAASVLALRAAALELDDAAFAARVAVFAALGAELGEPLAVVAMTDRQAAAGVQEWVRAAGRADAAWQQHQGDAAAYPGVAFLQLRARFAARASGRRD